MLSLNVDYLSSLLLHPDPYVPVTQI